MKLQSVMLLVLILILAGCGTKGKEYTVKFDIKNNTNTTINIDPSISSASGDSDTTSANTTDLPIKVPIDIGLNSAADELEKTIIDNVNNDLNDAVDPVTPPEEPVTPPEEPVIPPDTPVIPPEELTEKTVSSVFHTISDGRGVWNFPVGFMPPKTFTLTAGACLDNKKFTMGADGRTAPLGYAGWFGKPSEVPNRGYGILGKAGECLNLETVSISYSEE